MLVVHTILYLKPVDVGRIDVAYDYICRFPKNVAKAGKYFLVCFRGRHIRHSITSAPNFQKLLR